MIVLTVLSYSGVPSEGLSARFDELGGSIGRADNNQLVLPDPERSISRLHAKVIFRSGQYAIVDNGSNPIGVNGAAVPAGREQMIRPGDEVQIGSYLLKVSEAPATGATSANPFADLFGDGAQGLAGPVSPPSASAWASPPMVSAAPAPGGFAAQPVAGGMPPMRSATAAPAFGAPAASRWDAPAAGGWPAPAQPAPAAPAGGCGVLGDDWDFLAPAPPAASAFGAPADALGGFAAPASAGSPLGLSMGPGAVDSLDSLFGLGNAPTSGDPLGAAPAQAFLVQPNMAGHADPLQALGRQTADTGASLSDHVSELHTPMPLPRRAAAPPAGGGAQTAALPAPPPAGMPAGAIFSWDDPPRDGRLVTLPGMARTPAAPPGQAASAAAVAAALPAALSDPMADPLFGALFDPLVNPVSTALPDPLVDPLADLLSSGLTPPVAAAPAALAPTPAQAAAASALPSASPPATATAPAPAPAPASQWQAPAATPATANVDSAALLAALKQGLGVAGLRLDNLSPELMLLLGQLLRESTRGAVELLVARAALKREMRAEMTMIVARENNPLKFSPSVEVALQHLLAPTSPGFMPAAAAVRDAFDDLRAHQLGVMAGMKAALDGVLQRFDPQQLEAKLTTRSAIDSLIPSTRKARLWESFQQLFSQLSSEAQDDFDELFGKAFLRAYEAQLDRMHAEPGPR